jgi:Ca2+-transporting ATPase
VFSIVPLSLEEWGLVLLFALPVILIDEVLKFLGRNFFGVQAVEVAPRSRASLEAQRGGKVKAA